MEMESATAVIGHNININIHSFANSDSEYRRIGWQ